MWIARSARGIQTSTRALATSVRPLADRADRPAMQHTPRARSHVTRPALLELRVVLRLRADAAHAIACAVRPRARPTRRAAGDASTTRVAVGSCRLGLDGSGSDRRHASDGSTRDTARLDRRRRTSRGTRLGEPPRRGSRGHGRRGASAGPRADRSHGEHAAWLRAQYHAASAASDHELTGLRGASREQLDHAHHRRRETYEAKPRLTEGALAKRLSSRAALAH
jgi:hypothetical protein